MALPSFHVKPGAQEGTKPSFAASLRWHTYGTDDEEIAVTDVQIILPPIADETDVLELSLVTLTEAINWVAPKAVAHGVLGGEFGYGARYENEVFVMRPQWWGDCTCGEEETENPHKPTCAFELPNFVHKASGLTVNWYKWIGRDTTVDNPNGVDIAAVMRECVESVGK